MRNTGVKELKISTSDLLTTLIQLANESEWNINELIEMNLNKIKNRSLQYKSLGRKKRIAIYGVAFDPCHLGHIQVAQFVLNTSSYFDEVWMMPAYNHIYNKQMASTENRLEMCKLAANVDSRIKVFDYEIRNKLAGETYKLVKMLKNDKDYENYDFSFIIGQDNANTFHKWINYEYLEQMMKFVIIPRKGIVRDNNVNWYLNKPHIYLNKEDEYNIMEVSSTCVKKILKKIYSNGFNSELEHNIKKYLNDDILSYILKHNLYNE